MEYEGDGDANVNGTLGTIAKGSEKRLKDSEIRWSYLPTPPLGQDVTQGQFLSEV